MRFRAEETLSKDSNKNTCVVLAAFDLKQQRTGNAFLSAEEDHVARRLKRRCNFRSNLIGREIFQNKTFSIDRFKIDHRMHRNISIRTNEMS